LTQDVKVGIKFTFFLLIAEHVEFSCFLYLPKIS
jgi:hypothetical protein